MSYTRMNYVEYTSKDIAGLTFSLQHIGTVSVLVDCIAFVSFFALTSKENANDN